MNNPNKVQYNLKNVHYAKLTSSEGGVYGYEIPVPLPGAVSLSASAVGETTPFFADGYEYFTSISNSGYEGELEIALLPESFVTSILGETLSVTDKVLVESNSAKPAPFALLFEFEGDQKSIKRVMYNCMATRPSVEGSTNTESIEVKPQTLSFKSTARTDGKIKAQTTDATPDEIMNGWYASVWQGDAAA